ncbi:MAG TPA: hypothetical protein VFA04_20090 [Bryobacteraceae bacterium]|nr:hypothetical protein [Bryobacteraceae bacterium]
MACTIAAAFLLSALHAETMEERGKRVVQEAIATLGGDAFLNIRNVEEHGRLYSFYREQLQGLAVATLYFEYRKPAHPNDVGMVERQSFGKGKKEDFAVLFTPTEAWELTFRGARPLASDRFPRYKLTTMHDVFYILRQRLHEPGMTFLGQGQDVLDNRPVEIVDIIDNNNEKTTVYFDATLKVPIRQKFYHLDPIDNQQDEEVTYYTKYRDVGNGVQWPFDLQREHNKEKVFEIYADSVEINKNLPDTLFRLPGDVKILQRVD